MSEKSGSELTDQVLVLLRRIIRATDLYSRQLGRETGLTTPQLVVMRALRDGDVQNASDIAHAVSLSQATVTSILGRLEAGGLIRRERSREDRRCVNVVATAKGKRIQSSAPQPLQEEFIARFSALADWEQHQILSSLARVADMMDARDLDAAPLLATGEPDQ